MKLRRRKSRRLCVALVGKRDALLQILAVSSAYASMHRHERAAAMSGEATVARWFEALRAPMPTRSEYSSSNSVSFMLVVLALDPLLRRSTWRRNLGTRGDEG